ncbi:MAG: hypothetical protein ACE5F9_09225 [Phycisphaerae bacterium]
MTYVQWGGVNPGVLIACGVTAAGMIVTIAVRRHRDRSAGRARAERHGWELVCRGDDLRERLAATGLMEIGHSRRIRRAFSDAGPTYLFEYVFDTGFEHRRRSHPWIVAARCTDHACERAVLTSQDWIASVCRQPWLRELTVPGATEASWLAIVDDADVWAERLRGDVGRWLAQQPAERTWEIVPGYVVAYEPGRLRDDALDTLGSASAELERLLMAPLPKKNG